MQHPTPEPTILDAPAEIAQAKRLLARQESSAALRLTSRLLVEHPGDRELLYTHAVAQRLAGRIAEALATLTRMQALFPRFPRLFQEIGLCHATQHAAPAAILALERAVELSPSLAASWSMLESLYAQMQRTEDSRRAAERFRQLSALPREILTACNLYADGDAEEAEKRVRHFLTTRGHHVEALRLLAQMALDCEIVDDASVLLEYAVQAAPEHQVARYEYVGALMKQYRHPEALAQVRQLQALQPDNLVYRMTHAMLLARTDDVAGALAEFRGLIAAHPDDADLHLYFADALRTSGDETGAVASYHRAIALRPGSSVGYWNLANLKTYRFSAPEAARLKSIEAAPDLSTSDRIQMCFALGKAHEDIADHAAAFAYYARGNALKRAGVRYQPEAIERIAAEQMRLCTAEFFASRDDFGTGSRAPVFIVGLPRSGSTLIEQILAAHSQVQGTMELAAIGRLVVGLRGRTSGAGETGYPRILGDLTAADCRELGERYLTDTRTYRRNGSYFIDKMPGNFRDVALIHLILPNARIIDVRRDAMACCFSNFKQLFSSGQQFSYSFEDLARHYRCYCELMAHWDRVLPGRVLRVQYEHVVDDLDSEVRRILDHCGLDFEPACVNFHEGQRPVHTVSALQVRRPINRDGIDQWRRFESWLGPLRAALGTAVDGDMNP